MEDNIKKLNAITNTPAATPECGWLCPRCNRIISPRLDYCPFCDGDRGSSTIQSPLSDKLYWGSPTEIPC